MREGKDFRDIRECEKVLQDLSMMVSITGWDDTALPTGCLTTANLACLFQERTGHLPYQISVLNDKEALVEFEKGVPIMELLQELHGIGSWGELEVDIGCVISGKASLMNIFREREVQKAQKKDMRTQFFELKQEQRNYQSQLAEVVQSLQDKINVMETNNKERIVPIPGTPLGSCVDLEGKVVYKN